MGDLFDVVTEAFSPARDPDGRLRARDAGEIVQRVREQLEDVTLKTFTRVLEDAGLDLATALDLEQRYIAIHRAGKDLEALRKAGKLDEELPPKRLHGLETTYRLFGLLPDTLQLRPLLIDLYTEQVAGFYDPDSATLFGVEGADRTQLSLVLAHEMIHALQGQHLPLDSILDARENNDRLSAAQAILEGQATLASLEPAVRAAGLASPMLFVIGPVVEVLAQGDAPALAAAFHGVAMPEQVGHA